MQFYEMTVDEAIKDFPEYKEILSIFLDDEKYIVRVLPSGPFVNGYLEIGYPEDTEWTIK